ncbi:hypothetical protein PoB_001604900 [Plakobranchus ocellatus]|uniref:Uncharacterized protein n=1 Tax=Plakobranchus ocellatus TaxID=259542 RepID=A0AAV3Z6C3_9GAST|nr:hypothetical protein PoB_001604900 [Plakobranchus ocellatus]
MAAPSGSVFATQPLPGNSLALSAEADPGRGSGRWMGRKQPRRLVLMLLGPPSGQGAGGGARTRDRRVPAVLRADSLHCATDAPI